MALSDREQKMLEEIESALTEDHEFTQTVRKVNARHGDRTVLRGWALIAVGVVVLIAGFVVKIAGFPIISLVGFCFMLWGGIMLIKYADKRHGNPAFRQGKGGGRSWKKPPATDGSLSGLGGRFHERFDDPDS